MIAKKFFLASISGLNRGGEVLIFLFFDALDVGIAEKCMNVLICLCCGGTF